MIIRTKDFQIPGKVEVEKETLTKTYGKFFAEPFERGFGTTVGNSLRRVLLSSIAGAAVTSIKIEGVQHEFSTLAGMKEDVTDLILNIKQLRLRMHTDKAQTMQLKKKGAGDVFAKEIMHSSDIEILTPDLRIATLDKDANLDMDMTVNIGRGYMPAERNKEEGMTIGVIPIDAIFTPIQKVSLGVENARVGRRSDYDRLILEIFTDGSIQPEDALGFAGKILKDHLTIFINFEEIAEDAHGNRDGGGPFNKNLMKQVGELDLSVRAANCLKNAGIQTISDLVQRTETEMLETKNFGVKSLSEIKERLTSMGLSFGMQLEGFVPPPAPPVAEKPVE
ncbi:MAG: DNA-directed RNA polymerase subunit alpha [Nitrospirae bacterium]|nr:DNA-directed RNA polymerase subunit alpha [Candidatus Troglogloeales bacterium]